VLAQITGRMRRLGVIVCVIPASRQRHYVIDVVVEGIDGVATDSADFVVRL